MSNEGPEISPTLTKGLKRKRGRPKKQPQEDGGNTAVIPQDAVESQPVKKPRGRPKGSKKATVLTGRTAEPAAGKRPRGRPRKWPQAVVQEGESQGGNSLEGRDLNLNSAAATQVVTTSAEVEVENGKKICQSFPRSPTSEVLVTGTGITGKDGSRSGKSTGLSRCLSNIPAAAQ